jgi:hypothetical protein
VTQTNACSLFEWGSYGNNAHLNVISRPSTPAHPPLSIVHAAVKRRTTNTLNIYFLPRSAQRSRLPVATPEYTTSSMQKRRAVDVTINYASEHLKLVFRRRAGLVSRRFVVRPCWWPCAREVRGSEQGFWNGNNAGAKGVKRDGNVTSTGG